MATRSKDDILLEMQETRTAISTLLRGESVSRFTSSSGDYLKTFYLDTITLEGLREHLRALQTELEACYPEETPIRFRSSSTPVIVTKFGR